MSSPWPTANDEGLKTSAEPLVAGHFQRRFFWAGKQDWEVRRKRVWEREARPWFYRRIEESEPRLWRGSFNSSWSVPPQFQCLFHPNSSKVAPSRCTVVSAVLNLG